MDRVNTKISRRPDGNGCDENASVVNRAPLFRSQLHKQTWWEKFKFQQPSNPKFNNPAVQSSLKHSRKSSSNFFGGNFFQPCRLRFNSALQANTKRHDKAKVAHSMYAHEVVKRPLSPQMLPDQACHTDQPQQARPGVEGQKLDWLTGYRILFFKLETEKEIDRKISSTRSRWL